MLIDKKSSPAGVSGSAKTLAVPALIVAGVMLSALLVVLPKYREISSLRSSIEKNEKKLAQLTVKSNYLQGLNQKNLAAKAGYLVKLLPEDKKVPYLFGLFKLLATRNHLELVSLTVNPGSLTGDDDGKAKVPIMGFNQNLVGSMADIRQYFADIEKVAPLMVIEDFSLAGSRKQGESGAMELVMTVGTPYLFLPEKIGSVESPLVEMTTEDDLIYRRFSNFKVESDLENQILRKIPVGKPNPFSY